MVVGCDTTHETGDRAPGHTRKKNLRLEGGALDPRFGRVLRFEAGGVLKPILAVDARAILGVEHYFRQFVLGFYNQL